jgi:magnesium transporter
MIGVDPRCPVVAMSADGAAVLGPTCGCLAQVVEFDFETKRERALAFDQSLAAIRAGKFVWIDLDVRDVSEARERLAVFSELEETIVDDALTSEAVTRHARYEACLHVVVAGYHQREQAFELERVDIVIGQGFLLTIHRGPALFLEGVRRDYRATFARFAKNPSFLLYEIWDHLIENYLAVQERMEERVEALQEELRKDTVDNEVFARISDLGADLLHFRKVLLPARAVLADLATRRTLFISKKTQPALQNLIGTLEHVLQDLIVDRDILSESLNLYMSLVSHRTNEVLKRLTVVSVIFLPLTFLCGVYGMNFEILPELHWPNGYQFFWSMVVVIVLTLLTLMRRAKLL